MVRALVGLVLMVLALAAPAQRVIKCTQADGSVSYQQTACAGNAAQEALQVHAPPPPTPIRHMVQAFDPETGVPTQMWMDGPAPPTGATYTTREMRQVFDPETGIPHEMWVDVTKPVPQDPDLNQRSYNNGYQGYSTPAPRPRQRSNSRYNDGDNSVYEKAKCRVAHGSAC